MKQQQTLLVLGSGIAGIVTALTAHWAGYEVTVVSKSPDPRRSALPDLFSSTFGGEDSRYVTLTEGHPYLGTNLYVNEMYPDMQGAFATSIFQGGWLSQEVDKFSELDCRWLYKRYRSNEDPVEITRLFEAYIRENCESIELWRDLLDSLGDIKATIDLNDKGIMRLYGNKNLFLMAERFYRKHRVLLQTLSPEELGKLYPTYLEACIQQKLIGALIVKGFTFRVQRLVRAIIALLENEGVQFKFDTNVHTLERDQSGRVVGLRTEKFTLLSAHHYSLHPGAYDSGLLFSETGADKQIAGVAGGWISMPMPTGMELPVKIHDGKHEINGVKRPVVDLNLNPVTGEDGKKLLIIGGGYLFVGVSPIDLPDDARNLMLAEIHRVTELYLGPAYREAKRNGLIQESKRICIRSFTPNDAELDVVLQTTSGGLATLEGGGNTGTTTKAPWIARRAINRFRKVDGLSYNNRSVASNE